MHVNTPCWLIETLSWYTVGLHSNEDKCLLEDTRGNLSSPEETVGVKTALVNEKVL